MWNIFLKSTLHKCILMQRLKSWWQWLKYQLSKTFPQNNNGKFRVSKSLCLAINNIDHVLQYIQPFVAVSTTLGWGQNWYTMKHIWSIYKDTFLVFFKLWTQWMLSYWQPTLLFCLAQTWDALMCFWSSQTDLPAVSIYILLVCLRALQINIR